MDEFSKLIPIRRGDDVEARPLRTPSGDAGDGTPRQPEAPWRLAVVEAWFVRARQAGLDTIEERRRARRDLSHGHSTGLPERPADVDG